MAQNRNKKTKSVPVKATPRLHRRVASRVTKHVAPHARRAQHWYLRRRVWQKITLWCIAIISLLLLGMYSVASWYRNKHAREPLVIGATFIPSYARYFDLNPKETIPAMIDDLGIRRC